MLAVLCLLSKVLADPLQSARLVNASLYAATFTSNIHYRNSIDYFDPDAMSRWLLNIWSLGVEWQFYMNYPVMMTLVARVFGKGALPAFVTAMFFASLILCLWAPVANV
jgi:peptidoglycan/LPS O-acetylase OafA/YrhL